MKIVNFIAVGDITLQTRDNSNPFSNIKSLFEKKDLLFGNLETVLSDEGEIAEKAVPLFNSPESVQWLKKAGFDIVNLANNHIIDRGIQGIINTIKCIESAEIQHIGVLSPINNQNYTIIEKEDIKIGFLGYTTGRFKNPKQCKISRVNESAIMQDIAQIKSRCDIIIVSLHWGIENIHYPSPEQIKIAHNIIDAGANVIVGHHPHVLQGIEEYHGGLIAYSLGNFQFNPELSQSLSNDSVLLSIDIDTEKIHRFSILPVKINPQFQPEIPQEKEREDIILYLKKISEPIISNKINKKWWFEQISDTYLKNNLSSYKKRIRLHGLLPFFECCFWLITPFCMNCYLALFRVFLRGKKNENITSNKFF